AHGTAGDNDLLRARARSNSNSPKEGTPTFRREAGPPSLPRSRRHGLDKVISPSTPAARATTRSRPGNEDLVYFPRKEICFHFRELTAACRQREKREASGASEGRFG
ncbi:unnamed protein product, partial [Ixodes hexagonus]